VCYFSRGLAPKEKKAARGSVQVIEKARNGQENPRKSKHFPLIHLARIWLGLARIWDDLAEIWNRERS
jgi:hypothetical protein